MRSCDISGNNQRINGSNRVEEWCDDFASLDAEKITTIQISGGNHDFHT